MINIGEQQRLLGQRAEEKSDHKFDDLFNLITSREWLEVAHAHVKRNAGSVTAGCDGICMSDFDRDFDRQIVTLQVSLKDGSFTPVPVRRVLIPKKDGRRRPLGIPAIKDRIVQEAIRMVLEPIYEADFSGESFGFRPNRSTADAIQYLYRQTTNSAKYFWAIEGDISSYFDRIGHKKLMKLLRRRIKDRKLLDLIWSFLRAGVMEGKLFTDTKAGTPQGGIISSLLANLYLHELDTFMTKLTQISDARRMWRRRRRWPNFTYARYADDFVVLTNGTRSQAQDFKEALAVFLKEELDLELSESKTKVTHVNDGFEFHGYEFKRSVTTQGSLGTRLHVPKRAIKEYRTKVAAITGVTSYEESATTKIIALNQLTNGWCHYYRFATDWSSHVGPLNHFVFERVWQWFRVKYKLTPAQVLKQYRTPTTPYTLGVQGINVVLPSTIKYKSYRGKRKVNPYTTEAPIDRESLDFQHTSWTGSESRKLKGYHELRTEILDRDDWTCQVTGEKLTPETAEVDHIRPVKKFRRPIDANRPTNLRAIGKTAHSEKSKSE